jgi:4'-phosphopantetheinyl transferase EntD
MLPEGFHIAQFSSGDAQVFLARFSPFAPLDFASLLTASELERLNGFKHPQRKMEFAATRILRHQLFGTAHIHYDAHGAPYIENEGSISISHCQGAVGIALCPSYKIGLDLEKPRPNIAQLAPKFLSAHEKSVFDIHSDIELTKIWSAKETLYKLAGRKQIHFKTDLLLDKDADGRWLGTIVNPDHLIYVKLNIFEEADLFITLNCAALVEKAKYS